MSTGLVSRTEALSAAKAAVDALSRALEDLGAMKVDPDGVRFFDLVVSDAELEQAYLNRLPKRHGGFA